MVVKGVLFDFDDTIAQTEQSRLISINHTLKEFNFEIEQEDWDKHFKKLNTRLVLQEIKDAHSFNYDVEEMYNKSHSFREDYIKKNGLVKIEGFDEFLFFLLEHNIKILICSGGTREHVKSNLEMLDIDLDFIAIEDFREPKPSPRCYIKGVEILNLKKDEVVVFDDSYNGILSANKAGIKAIGINVSYKEKIEHELDTLEIVDDYTQIDKDKFLDILD